MKKISFSQSIGLLVVAVAICVSSQAGWCAEDWVADMESSGVNRDLHRVDSSASSEQTQQQLVSDVLPGIGSHEVFEGGSFRLAKSETATPEGTRPSDSGEVEVPMAAPMVR